MGYTLTAGTTVIRDDSANIPNDPGNRDWQEYQDWLQAGNIPTPFTPPAPKVPEVISDRQFYQQLALGGTITQAEALAYVKTGTLPATLAAVVATLTPDQQFAVQMQIIGSVEYQRHNPTVMMLATALGWTDTQLNALWTAAALL